MCSTFKLYISPYRMGLHSYCAIQVCLSKFPCSYIHGSREYERCHLLVRSTTHTHLMFCLWAQISCSRSLQRPDWRGQVSNRFTS